VRPAAPGASDSRFLRIATWLLVAAALAAPAVAADPAATVDVAADAAGSTTRVVLTHSARVVYAVTTFEGRVEVVYADPVAFRPPAGEVGDGLLERWEARGDRTLVLHVGPGYAAFDSFELRNPLRLILDLKGDRDSRRPPGTERGEAPGATPRRADRPVLVVDPGHGGVENGAIGPGGVREKDVALDVARRLRAALARDDVTVVLTRDEDRHVDLDERAAIANHNRADLFVSIHLNASRRTGATGAETYYLSVDATDDDARAVAGIENAAAGAEVPELRDRGLDLVLWDLAQNRSLAESAALAEAVQAEMNALAGTRDRGVRQAPFRVLVGATMPAILVEIGFLTSPDEAARFEDPAYRDRVAEALARAVRAYLDDLGRGRRRAAP